MTKIAVRLSRVRSRLCSTHLEFILKYSLRDLAIRHEQIHYSHTPEYTSHQSRCAFSLTSCALL